MKKEIFDSPEKQFVLSVCPEVKMLTVKNTSNNIMRYEIHDYKTDETLAVSFANEQTAWVWAKLVVNTKLINKLNK